MNYSLNRKALAAFFLIIGFLMFTEAKSDGIKIEFSPPVFFRNEAKLVIHNSMPYPQVLKLDLYHVDNRSDPVARATVTVPAKSKVVELLAPLQDKSIGQAVYWHYVRGVGDLTKPANPGGFVIPFDKEINTLVCQYPHGNDPAIDFCVPIGTSVSAAKSGTVIWVVDEHGVGGPDKKYFDKANFVEIVHEDGSRAIYLHLLRGSITVNVGDRINAGDKIGKVGMSGQTSGPHLHFHVVKLNGSMRDDFIDPQFITPEGKPLVIKQKYLVSQNNSSPPIVERASNTGSSESDKQPSLCGQGLATDNERALDCQKRDN